MKVCKFGGSSLADPAQVNKVCNIIAADPARRVVVVSAPGKRHGDDLKVTDMLINCANLKLRGESPDAELKMIIDRYASLVEGLGLEHGLVEQIAADLNARIEHRAEHPEHFMDSMKAAGEDNCARVIAAALVKRGLNAHYLNPGEAGLLLSEQYGNAMVLPESYEQLAHLRDRSGITVVPGFFGYTRDGAVVTFPRGGSDITGSILAAAVAAELYENFTDVDSVLSADPSIVENAAPVLELTYREMRELSYAGFGVLHDEAIIPAVTAGIPICIRNTNNPAAPGTMIVPERKYEASKVVGIAASDGFCTILVNKYLMNREIGFGRRLLQIFEQEGLSYEHTPSGIDSMSVIVRQGDLDAARQKRILARIRSELAVDDVEVEHGLALIMIVGEGMRYTVGMAARAVTALAKAGVNIEMINQGASEISVMFGVKETDCRRAVRSLYREFFGEHHEVP
jgi:aspartate kinase